MIKDQASQDSTKKEESRLGRIEVTELDDGQLVDIVEEDEAIKFVKDGVTVDEKSNKKLRRKADIYVCTVMACVYALQYMDKTSNSSASIMGLIPDLGMRGNMYSWVGSSFYLGYLIFELPVSLAVQRFPLAKTTGIFVMLWGLTLACSAASQSYAGYISTRVILGALEGAITPSFLLLTSQWYKREEQFSRVSLWFAFNGVGQMLGSAIAYGLFIHKDSYGLPAWRILFIILGLITILLGLIFYLHIPDYPSQAWFLSEDERHQQVERIRDNKQGYGSHKIKWNQVKEAFIDPRTYIHFAITLLSDVPNGGVSNFSNILYTTLGYDDRESLLLGIANGAVIWGGPTLTTLLSLYIFPQYRILFWANLMNVFELMSLALVAWCPSTSGQLAGLFLFNWCQIINYTAILSCISSNTAGTTKKSISSATLLIGFCVGNLIGPQTFKESEQPSYTTAKVSMAACAAAMLVLYLMLTFINLYENKKRDKQNKKLPEGIVNAEFADLTDFENPEFRYCL